MDATPAAHLVGRMGTLLRALSAVNETGATTADLARATGLPRPTVHRLLVSLADEGFVDRDRRSGRWFLGPELYLLGGVAGIRYDITRQARESVHRLAASTGESAFFSARRGEETVCLLREDGDFPIRSFVLYEGARFPLGVVSAGLAVLSFLDDGEIDAYLAREDLVGRWGPAHAPHVLRERIAQTRVDGYAVNPGLVVEGSWGMAAAVFDQAGQPSGALTVTGVENRFRAERRPELGALLLREAHSLGRTLNTGAGTRR
ncbi:IclR family transcriptional regulator [Streptomyces turgidiscabies]|uniref:Transcriptional regulator, IclR family, C-terminal domain protein n=1 Tax=Streptomyces turgidiscabies (strain Car8) TaxID=698760 RepID=L7F4K6_STRT8|nr:MULTISPECIES: IclR family transcriptional regulator [Streptomyces]ELP66533.1 transcriptional regulator, IclR family, C-terminal domain protein [Streptomyces turgidiscabies Car8]MDX3494821.1 IclR family transcriptional regulator [Streptomyces turgidiscabies]GAQ71430.1 HTH-type transcriptional regulator KipR [Streptomyces turgidiscabies]